MEEQERALAADAQHIAEPMDISDSSEPHTVDEKEAGDVLMLAETSDEESSDPAKFPDNAQLMNDVHAKPGDSASVLKNERISDAKKTSPQGGGIKRKKSIADLSSDEEDFAGFDECNGETTEKMYKKMKEEGAPGKIEPAETTHIKSTTGSLPTPTSETELAKKDLSDIISGQIKEADTSAQEKVTVQSIVPPASQKQRSIKDVAFRKPFAFGWRREVVYRAAPGVSKDKGEVYYITPVGKKIRTRTELQLHLTPDLQIENFTFAREPIGMSAEEEMIRVAKPTARSIPVDMLLGKRIPKPKAPKGASPPPQGWTPVKAMKSSSPRTTAARGVVDVDLDGKGQIGSKSSSKQAKSAKKGEPCTIECVLAMGTIPQLQCTKCLCLYHHECIGVDRNETTVVGRKGNAALNSAGMPKGDTRYICEFCQNKAPAANQQQQQQKLPTVQGSPKSKTVSPKQMQSISETGANSIQNRDHDKPKEATKSQKNASKKGQDSENLPQSIAVVKGRKYVVIRKPNSLRQDRRGKQTSDENPSTLSLTTGEETQARKRGGNIRSSKSSEHLFSTESLGISAIRQPTLDNFANHYFFGNVSIGYDILLHTFQYLKVQELLRAACVCRIWNVAANHRSLWKTVRMKNSQVNDWSGLAAALKRNGTQHLDLRKMISSTNSEEMWSSFSKNIKEVGSLEVIDLCRCSSRIVENLFVSNPNLMVINALAIKDDTFSLTNVDRLLNLRELRLKSIDGFSLESTLAGLKVLTNLKHLSLTSVRDLGSKDVVVLGDLTNLESLDLGECNDLPASFASDVLLKLVNLERLRLEKGQDNCCTLEILETIAKLNKLQQLELVNFDIKAGFDENLTKCKNLKRLLLIPTYISQSATTNNIVLSAVLNLSESLQSLTWVVTLELLRVTALYVDQCDNKKKDKKFFDESIPVLKPVPGIYDETEKTQKATSDVPQVEILPLVRVEEILTAGMPNTKFKILKVPYHATWRQNLVDI